MNYIDFTAPCGHVVRVVNPKTANWDNLYCAFIQESGKKCMQKVNRRCRVEPKPEPIALTEQDIKLLKDMKISLE